MTNRKWTDGLNIKGVRRKAQSNQYDACHYSNKFRVEYRLETLEGVGKGNTALRHAVFKSESECRKFKESLIKTNTFNIGATTMVVLPDSIIMSGPTREIQ